LDVYALAKVSVYDALGCERAGQADL